LVKGLKIFILAFPLWILKEKGRKNSKMAWSKFIPISEHRASLKFHCVELIEVKGCLPDF
jgi:hypothetical protein